MEKTWSLLLSLLLFISCQRQHQSPATTYLNISGKTMGTTYAITYEAAPSHSYQHPINSLLGALNAELSTYIPTSTISTYNQSTDGIALENKSHFYNNLIAAIELHKKTNGFFDPTIAPLVNYWGFGTTGKSPIVKIDSSKVDSLKQLVGMDKIIFDKNKLFLGKKNKFIQLDFSAIAKGYGVDVIANYLEASNIENYLVEIGGEVKAKGKNDKGTLWTLGINTPSTDAALNDIIAIVQLNNKAMATSGNYRNYYKIDGIKYAHTLNPKTGFPESNTLLSTTIIANDCMTADAMATACMAMGLDAAQQLIMETDSVEAYFIYTSNDKKMKATYTKGFEHYIKSSNIN